MRREEVERLALDDDERPRADGLDGPGGVQLHLDALAQRPVREDADAGAGGRVERHGEGGAGRGGS